MAFKKLSAMSFIADSKRDLEDLPSDLGLGAQCYTIEEASEYRKTSTGRWIKQDVTEIVFTDSGEIDLSAYATKEYVNEQLDAINLDNYATLDNPVFKMVNVDDTNKTSIAGIQIMAMDNKPVLEVFKSTAVGMYSVYCENGVLGMPAEVIENNHNARGLWFIDRNQNGWMMMIDQGGDSYIQSVKDGIGLGWEMLSFVATWHS